MIDPTLIKQNANVMGADGVHIGTVDRVDGDRIRLTMANGPGIHQHHNHFIALSLVADVEASNVRLSANADVAVHFEEEKDGSAADA
jgi:hypothetical protein